MKDRAVTQYFEPEKCIISEQIHSDMARKTGKELRHGEKIRLAETSTERRDLNGVSRQKKTPHVLKTYGVSYLAAKKSLRVY